MQVQAKRPFQRVRRKSRATSSLLVTVALVSQWSQMSIVKASLAKTKISIPRRSLMWA